MDKSSTHALIGRRIAVCDWRESGDDEKDANPREGTVLDCRLGRGEDTESGVTSDYYILIEFDNGGIVCLMAPGDREALNRTYLRLLPVAG
jgi:hypothetical protein